MLIFGRMPHQKKSDPLNMYLMSLYPESVLWKGDCPDLVLRNGDVDGRLEYCSLGAGPAPLLGLS